MEDSVLSFLKAEWKVSNTGSAHWAASVRNNKNDWTQTAYEWSLNGFLQSLMFFMLIRNPRWPPMQNVVFSSVDYNTRKMIKHFFFLNIQTVLELHMIIRLSLTKKEFLCLFF